MILLGGSALILYFLVSLFQPEYEKGNYLAITVDYLLTPIMIISIIGFIFKTMKWPGGGVFALIASYLLAVIAVIFILIFLLDKEKKAFQVSKLLFSFLFIAVFPLIFYQSSAGKNKELMDNAEVVVSVDKMNVLEKNVPYDISVAVSGIPSHLVIIKVDGGEIVKAEGIHYQIIPKEDNLRITSFRLFENDTIELTKHLFKAEEKPNTNF
jgi:hypothetical protein